MTAADDIRLDASAHGPGQFRRTCPYCGGGSTNEASLAVRTNDRGQVSWRCFRASCGKFGGNLEVTARPIATLRPYRGDSVRLTSTEAQQLYDSYEIGASTLTKDVDSGRILLPVRGPEQQARGFVARDVTGTLSPKVLTYKAIDEPFIHWTYSWPEGDEDLVIVEDWFSAQKVCGIENARAIALNGTYCSPGAMEEIVANAGKSQVHVALDRDAFAKGVKLAYDLAITLSRPVFSWRLGQDLKYVRYDRIERALREREFDFISNH